MSSQVKKGIYRSTLPKPSRLLRGSTSSSSGSSNRTRRSNGSSSETRAKCSLQEGDMLHTVTDHEEKTRPHSVIVTYLGDDIECTNKREIYSRAQVSFPKIHAGEPEPYNIIVRKTNRRVTGVELTRAYHSNPSFPRFLSAKYLNGGSGSGSASRRQTQKAKRQAKLDW